MYDKKKVVLFTLLVLIVAALGAILFLGGESSTDPSSQEVKEDDPVDEESSTQDETPQENTEESIAALDEELKTKLLDEVYLAWSNGQVTEATTQIEKLLTTYPDDIDVVVEAAQFYFANTSDPQKPIQLLEAYVEKFPDNPKALAFLAVFYDETYNEKYFGPAVEAAEKALNIALEMDGLLPEEVVFYFDTYAWAVALQGDFGLASEIYVYDVFQNDFINFDDPSSMIHYAFVMEMAGDVETAVQVYQDILGMDPTLIPESKFPDFGFAQNAAQNALKELGIETPQDTSTSKEK